ncbi:MULTISPECIES: heavy-metal-associated domain-containing protein [Enterococcus]|uniref:HMA domain-containing protein n=1 Tax=Enterococcus diestrammenae TaxID=1155073 RepID=A0ABV0F2Q8_9ENTE|nr:heavy-metal-associated domain-containing protein [Enterococcus diestrammenae]KAF1298517.1 heavy metal-binding protein [Enterococcus diestrammenae]HIX70295.1 cation transporter [Candidatus Enterococcus stercoravium]
MEKVILQLGALACPSCMQKIEAGVKAQPGVENVKVLFNASKVKADIDASQTSGDKLKEVIENLGYEVESVKVKAS